MMPFAIPPARRGCAVLLQKRKDYQNTGEQEKRGVVKAKFLLGNGGM
jgi:hypothetical protein